MNFKYSKIMLALSAALLVHGTANAEKVTFITIEDVGYGGQGDYNPPSTSFKDDGCPLAAEPCNGTNSINGMAGVFAFGGLTSTDAPGDPNYYLSTSLEDVTDPNTVPKSPTGGFPHPSQRSRVFITDFSAIDTSIAQDIYTFSAGFGFAGYPFYPRTDGPSDIDINYIDGSDPDNELVVNSFPFAGVYGTDSFVLGPQTVDPIVTAAEAASPNAGGIVEGEKVCQAANQPFELLRVRWINRIDNTDRYNYKMVWTHCITLTENPSGSFDGNRAAWIIEGVMTAPDTTSPTIASINPTDGSTTHPIDNAVSVTFSERMDPSTITTTTFTVSPTAGGPSECDTPIIASADLKTYTCNPVGGLFSLTTAYDINITTAVTDNPEDNSDTSYATGVALASAFSSSFTTSAADTVAPTFVSSSPVDGATGVVDSSTISATFADNSNAMASITSTAISVSVNGSQLLGNVTTGDNLTFTFTPVAPLFSNTVHTIDIDNSIAQDGSGNVVGGASVTNTFTTAVVASLPTTPVAGQPVVSVDTSAGASMVNLALTSPAQIGGTLPDRVTMDNTFVDFIINGFSDGQAVVTIDFGFDYVSEGKSVYKAIDGEYRKLIKDTEYTQVNNSTIQMTITDDDPLFDIETSLLNTIRDPIGTGLDKGEKPVPGSLSGCSVTGVKVSPFDRADLILVLGIVLGLGLVRIKLKRKKI